MQIELEQFVEAPVEKVFGASADFAGTADRIAGIERVEMLTSGPVGVGTRFRETRRMMGKEAVEEMEVTAFEPNRHYVVEADSCGAHFTSRFDFTPEKGGTRVRLSVASQAMSFGAKLMAPLGFLMKGAMRKAMQQDLIDLARSVEAPEETVGGPE